MIVACYITFNDIETIQTSIESIYNQVDRIVVVDGRFTDFDWPADHSTDGTIEYLQTLAKVELSLAQPTTEPQKRSQYLTPLHDGDTVLNLDGDEELVGQLLPLETDVCGIRIFDRNDHNGKLRYCRHFIYREGMHYDKKHYLLKDAQGKLVASLKRVGEYTSVINKQIYLINNSYARSAARNKAKTKYYRTLIYQECKISDFD